MLRDHVSAKMQACQIDSIGGYVYFLLVTFFNASGTCPGGDHEYNMRLEGNLPPGHDALLFSTSGKGSFIGPVAKQGWSYII